MSIGGLLKLSVKESNYKNNISNQSIDHSKQKNGKTPTPKFTNNYQNKADNDMHCMIVDGDDADLNMKRTFVMSAIGKKNC